MGYPIDSGAFKKIVNNMLVYIGVKCSNKLPGALGPFRCLYGSCCKFYKKRLQLIILPVGWGSCSIFVWMFVLCFLYNIYITENPILIHLYYQ